MKILISNLQGLMPDGYVETILTDQNVQKIGLHEEIFLTDQKHRLTTEFNSIAKEQRIQALIYDKYKLQFVVKDTYTIELMNHGDVIIKDDDNYSEYHAVVLDINKSQIAGRFFSVEVEFYDINPENYVASIIEPINYLENNYVLDKYGFSATNMLRVWDDSGIKPIPLFTAHTILIPDLTTNQPLTESLTASNGSLVRPNVIVKQFIEGLFYLNQEDKQNLLSLLPLAGNQIVKAWMIVANNSYKLLETPDFESVKLNASNLWQVNVKYAYKIINHYEYAN